MTMVGAFCRAYGVEGIGVFGLLTQPMTMVRSFRRAYGVEGMGTYSSSGSGERLDANAFLMDLGLRYRRLF